MTQFTYKTIDELIDVTVTLNDDATLEDQVAAFESFLLAAGYRFEGELEFIPTEGVNYDFEGRNDEN